MFRMNAINPVSDFSRKPAEHIKRLKETGKPEILTVNGENLESMLSSSWLEEAHHIKALTFKY